MTTLVLALVTTKRPQNPRTITTTVFFSPFQPYRASKKDWAAFRRRRHLLNAKVSQNAIQTLQRIRRTTPNRTHPTPPPNMEPQGNR